LNQLQALKNRPRQQARITRQSRLFKIIIKAIADKKGEEIVSLDMRKIHEAVADFFIICQASTNTQVKAIGDYIQDMVKEELGEIPYKTEGYQQGKWVLIDYVNVVVHIMHPEQRGFYRIEEMWSDAQLQHHEA
jgi:ribosome-associated protein